MLKRSSRRAPDRDLSNALSSTLGRIGGLLLLCASVVAAAAVGVGLNPVQRDWYRARLNVSKPAATSAPAPAATPAAPAVVADPLAEAILSWNRLRQSDRLPFNDYASFLIAHPGWPGEESLRRAAERALLPDGQFPAQVVAFFTRLPPLTPAGNLRYAEALMAVGRGGEAQAAARLAWTGGALAPDDESRLLARFGSALQPADHDARMERLLWSRSTTAATRQLAMVSSARRPIYQARLAMQMNDPNAAAYALALGDTANRDAGFVNDRARWLRDNNQWPAAREYLARSRALDAPPLDAKAWYETLLGMAQGSYNDNQWAQAYAIASQVGDAYAPGVAPRDRTFGERDSYTDLVWLAGNAALKMGNSFDAMRMFQLYASGARSAQVQAKGYYWSGRAAEAAGRTADAQTLWQLASAFHDQFYGQLATERLGQALPPPQLLPEMPADPTVANAFNQREIVRAARMLGEIGDWKTQTVFLRAIAQQATDGDRVLIDRLSADLGRPDLAVMMARQARSDGTDSYVRAGFPTLALSSFHDTQWTMIHAISRQESQFDRRAVSRSNARGLMQLMPRTAEEQAGKLGMNYSYDRLTDDPSYNVMLGSQYFQRLRDSFGGSYLLAVAAYNAGPGNVRRWIEANGDPRLPGADVVNWIEQIPLSETRGYVQHVLENAVVYDLLNPDRARMPTTNRLSAYLGKSRPG
jgi:soluble lytic murein transglycosylase